MFGNALGEATGDGPQGVHTGFGDGDDDDDATEKAPYGVLNPSGPSAAVEGGGAAAAAEKVAGVPVRGRRRGGRPLPSTWVVGRAADGGAEA